VHVNRPPYADAGPDHQVCPGDEVLFDASGSRDADGEIIHYRWDFGDGSTGEGETARHVFSQPGTYRATLTATDDSGSICATANDSVDIFVNAPPVADAGGDREVWIGGAHDALLLDGSASSDPDGKALSYAWRIGEEGSEFGERVRYPLSQAGTHEVELTVSDTSGLACGTASAKVRVIARER